VYINFLGLALSAYENKGKSAYSFLKSILMFVNLFLICHVHFDIIKITEFKKKPKVLYRDLAICSLEKWN